MAAKVLREAGNKILNSIYIDFNLQTIYAIKCFANRSKISNTIRFPPTPQHHHHHHTWNINHFLKKKC